MKITEEEIFEELAKHLDWLEKNPGHPYKCFSERTVKLCVKMLNFMEVSREVMRKENKISENSN